MEEIGWKVVRKPIANSGEITIKNQKYILKEMFELSEKESRLLHSMFSEFKERIKQSNENTNVETEMRKILKEFCEESNLILEKKRGEKILRIAEMNLSGYGVLDLLLKDENLEEISFISASQPIRVYHKLYGWLETNCFITSEEFAIDLINKMAKELGRRITYENPRINATLPNGFRLHASIPPISQKGVEITIRRFRENPITVLEMIQNCTLTKKAGAFLWLASSSDLSVIIAGNTGSGKTSLLNALFSFVPLNERIVIVEETPEINISHKHKINLLANEELNINLKDLAKDTLRMRPDRVIIGEARGREEVEALFDSLLAGQAKGTFATFHSQTANEAVRRLVSFGINKEDLNALDLIIIIKRISQYEKGRYMKDVRRVTEIASIENGKLRVLFNFIERRLRETKELKNSLLLEKIGMNHNLKREEVLEEMKKREKFLESLQNQNLNYFGFTQRLNNYNNEQ